MAKPKQQLFADLVRRVEVCDICPRMKNRKRVLSLSNGSLQSPVVFIAEAPGRFGADRFGIPLYGDQTGRNFEMLLAAAGLIRESVFITNAVLCNPRTPDDNNDSPRLSEIHNCSHYLKETLAIIEPKYIVPLGVTALASLNTIRRHHINLSEDAGKLFPWNGSLIYPLFHPGPRALIRRPKAQQIEDYKALARMIRNPH